MKRWTRSTTTLLWIISRSSVSAFARQPSRCASPSTTTSSYFFATRSDGDIDDQKVQTMTSNNSEWTPGDVDQAKEARTKLEIWPLDEHNAKLLNLVHPYKYETKLKDGQNDPPVYDLIAVGSGAGGLVSSRQSARRGATSALISEGLAGGDCLNIGCVPSKALIRSARAASQVRRAAEFGIVIEGPITVDFAKVMTRLREKRATIAPADGHPGTESAGAHVYQGRGRMTSKDTIEVNGKTLKFKKLVLVSTATTTTKKNPNCSQFDDLLTINHSVFPGNRRTTWSSARSGAEGRALHHQREPLQLGSPSCTYDHSRSWCDCT